MNGPLVPPNSTTLEFNLDEISARLELIPVDIALLWSADRCPERFLPYLAWAMSVDNWDPAWSDESKRNVIRNSVFVHRAKGTRASIRRALEAAGYGDAEIIELPGAAIRDGSAPRDGTIARGRVNHWAEYKIALNRPISKAEGERVRKILIEIAPVRCHLSGLDFSEVQFKRDGTITRDGRFTRGLV